MAETVTISLVTPSFNQGRFIEETIRSVLMQEGDFFLDYIIMDGGSTDQSVDIIRKYDAMVREGRLAIKCRGISYRWVSEKDRGQVDALHKGFRQATGEIFGWLNSDDVLLGADALRKVAGNFAAQPDLDLFTADGNFIDAGGKTLGVHHVDQIVFKELLYLDYHILQPSTFFRKRVYLEERLRLDYVCAFDADFFIGLINDGAHYLKTDDVLSGFRIYPEIKTLALGGRRYREQLSIALRYGGNFAFWVVSAIYRYCEIVLRHRWRSAFFGRIFGLMQRMAYLAVTGKATR